MRSATVALSCAFFSWRVSIRTWDITVVFVAAKPEVCPLSGGPTISLALAHRPIQESRYGWFAIVPARPIDGCARVVLRERSVRGGGEAFRGFARGYGSVLVC